MFLYHYLVAVIFGIMAIAYIVEYLPKKIKNISVIILLVLSASIFSLFSPVSYGTPLSDKRFRPEYGCLHGDNNDKITHMPEALISWSAPEHLHTEKQADWYWAVE